uniref:EphrinA-a ephrin n=1 Tax=Phallusia mammillata TaxID=59560 RepID=A0A6F9DB30_9ASCI|nr:EphrinA-a ephrin precursor [Phallusia mammillata]
MLFVASIFLIAFGPRFLTAAKFEIQWDPVLEPRLGKGIMHLEVDVDDWLDIICPYTSVHKRHRSTNRHLLIELFNVTKEEFTQCTATRERTILRCFDPEHETKLTTKFQKRSPSPVGFVFKPGHTYYYFSKPRTKQSGTCDKDILKLVITIRKEKDQGQDSKHKNSWKNNRGPEIFIQSPDAISNTRDHKRENHNKHKPMDPVVRPIVKTPQAPRASAAASSNNDDNAATRIHQVSFGLTLSSFLIALLMCMYVA